MDEENKQTDEELDARGRKIGKRKNNGKVKRMLVGWGRDSEGNLLLPKNEKVLLTRGWATGLAKEEREMVLDHNANVEDKSDYELFEEQNRKKQAYTLVQRLSALSNAASLQLVNELELRPLPPLRVNDKVSIDRRRAAIAAYNDTIKFCKALIDYKDLVALEAQEDNTTPIADGVTNIEEVRKRLSELKKERGRKQ